MGVIYECDGPGCSHTRPIKSKFLQVTTPGSMSERKDYIFCGFKCFQERAVVDGLVDG